MTQAPTIDQLRPDPRDPTLVHVLVKGRKVASVPVSKVDSIGLAVGAAWTPELGAACEQALDVRRALRKAAGLLKHGDRSRTELLESLQKAGFSELVAAMAASELERKGLAGDERAAQAEIEKRLRRLPAGRLLLEERLRARGIDPEHVADVLDAAVPGTERERALAAAYAIFERQADDLTPLASWRRMVAALARRGFDEATAQDAARTVLGSVPDEE